MRYFLVVLALFACLNVQADSAPSFAQIDISLDDKQVLPLSNKISFELHSSKTEGLAKSLLNWNNITVKQSNDDTLAISIIGTSKSISKVLNKYSAESFVIDIEEESVKKFTSAFVQEVKQSSSLHELEHYVHEYITDPTYINGFHIASVVASQRSGDCTEYAVLTTSLARSLGLPSRLVLGTVIIETKDEVQAIGHAWTEVWFNDEWQIVDAALYGAQDIQRFYLPSGYLENEGPGYVMSLYTVMTRMPQKISNLRSFK